MSNHESKVATHQLLSSMSPKKRAEYNFCFRATGSSKFFFALLRQPSFLKAKDLDKLLKEWANIRNSSEYKEAIENRTKRKEPEAEQQAELQKLRIEINHCNQAAHDRPHDAYPMARLGTCLLPSACTARTAHQATR